MTKLQIVIVREICFDTELGIEGLEALTCQLYQYVDLLWSRYHEN